MSSPESELETGLLWADERCLYGDVNVVQYLPSNLPSLQEDLEEGLGLPTVESLYQSSLQGKPLVDERWQVDKDAAEYLASCFALLPQSSIPDVPASKSLKRIKLEEPALSEDHELHMRKIKRRNEVTLHAHGMQPLPSTNGMDAGFSWTREELAIRDEIDTISKNEKLEVDREAMTCLRDVFLLGRVTDPMALLTKFKAERESRPDQGSPSPSLFPLSSSVESTDASSDIIHSDIPMTSGFSATGLTMLDRELNLPSDGDNTKANAPALGSTCGLSNAINDVYQTTKQDVSISHPPLKRKAKSKLELDISLTSVDVSSDLSAKRPKDSRPKISPGSSDQDMHKHLHGFEVSEGDGGIPDCVQSVLQSTAENAIQEVSNDHREAEDSTLKVPVPDIQPTLVREPQFERGQHSPRENNETTVFVPLLEVHRSLPMDLSTWSMSSAKEKDLLWVPFPSRLAMVKVDEDVDDGSLESYLAGLSFMKKSVDLSVHYKQHGQSNGAISPEGELLHHVNIEADAVPDPLPDRSENLIAAAAKREQRPCSTAFEKATTATGPADLRYGGDLSTDSTPSLDELLQHHRTRLSHCDIQFLNGQLEVGASLIGPSYPRDTLCTAPVVQEDGPSAMQPPIAPVDPVETMRNDPRDKVSPGQAFTAALPTFEGDSHQDLSVVVTPEISSNTSLIRALQRRLPSLDLIERDPKVPDVAKHGYPSPAAIAVDADLTLSPGAGVIVTTLQKLKQKPLPGQSSFSGIQDRLQAVAERYERLFILVSEGRPDNTLGNDSPAPTQHIDDRDCTAFADFSAFAAVATPARTQVKYIAGGQSELVEWIVALISQQTNTIEDSARANTVLHEETTWEAFLRKAGLDPLSAQAILHMLKNDNVDRGAIPETSNNADDNDVRKGHGLHAFVKMSAEDRLETFGALLGGRRVVSKISGIVDRHWDSLSTERYH